MSRQSESRGGFFLIFLNHRWRHTNVHRVNDNQIGFQKKFESHVKLYRLLNELCTDTYGQLKSVEHSL